MVGDALYRSCFEHAPFGVQIFALDGTSLWMNEAHASLLGIPSPEVGVGVYNALTDPWSIEVGSAALFRRALAGEPVDAPDPALDFGNESNAWETRRERRYVRHRFVPVRGASGELEAIALFAWDTTEQVRAQRNSEARFRHLVSSSKDSVVMVSATGVMFVNAACERLFGYTLEEYRAEPDLPPRMLVDDVSRQWFKAFWDSFAERGEWPESDAVLSWRARDGRVVVVEHRFTNVRADDGTLLGFLNIGRDITERVRSDAVVRRANERSEMAARAAGIAFFEQDLRAGTLEIDPRFLEALGVPTDLRDQSLFAFLHPDDLALVEAHRDRVVAGSAPGFLDYRVRDGRGGWRWVRSYVARGAGEAQLVGTLQDVTELRELQQRAAELQKQEAVGRLAAGIAHDFNNLLTVIQGAAEGLGDRRSPPGEIAQLAAEITDACGAAGALVRKLREATRPDPREPRWVELDALVRGRERVLAKLASPDARVVLELDAPGAEVFADATQLEQVLINLVVNARDARPASSTIVVRTTRGEGSRVELTVIDDGSGMTPEVSARATEPYFTTKPVGSGTGLGLAIVASVARETGAELRIDSAPRVGTAITLTFPAHAATRTPTLVPRARGSKVLVVDDDPRVRRATVRVLRQHGHEVLEAEDAASASEMLDRHPDVALVLTDWRMPDGGGARVIEAIQKREREPAAIVVSGHLDERPPVLAGVPVLAKPWSRDALLEAVAEALEHHEARVG